MTTDTTPLQHTIIRLSELPSEQIMLEPSLIKDLLRRRQKLAISAPKVSLKTSLAIHLAVSVAYGLNWLGWQCNSSKILYVNLNISKQECIVRFNKAIEHLQLDRTSVSNIDILNIEVTQGISNLVDDIIQAMNTQHYRAVVIDSLDNIPTPTWQKEN
ncbi:TPA: AAA family ATPase, partial [Streptococcus suis]